MLRSSVAFAKSPAAPPPLTLFVIFPAVRSAGES
jgi:hypothetical protein